MRAEYDAYLRSPAWAKLRRKCLQRDHYRCVACGSRETLHVHHLTYERFGREPPSDLTTLCASCHATLHELVTEGAGPIANPLGVLFSRERAERYRREHPVVARDALERETFEHQRAIEASRERMLSQDRSNTAADRERALAVAAALGLKAPKLP